MSKQLLLEVSLIGSLSLVIGILMIAFKRADYSPVVMLHKLLTGLLGSFLVMAGTVKFFEPFNTMFNKQIELSELPLPELARWAGQLGEISVGLGLIAVLILSNKVSTTTIKRLFYGASALTLSIMSVAVYVHLIPNVPAEVLPLQSKPPVLTLIIMVLVGLNILIFKKDK